VEFISLLPGRDKYGVRTKFGSFIIERFDEHVDSVLKKYAVACHCNVGWKGGRPVN